MQFINQLNITLFMFMTKRLLLGSVPWIVYWNNTFLHLPSLSCTPYPNWLTLFVSLIIIFSTLTDDRNYVETNLIIDGNPFS